MKAALAEGEQAKKDLESAGYQVERIRLSCSDLGADHQRNRFWLMAVKDWKVFARIAAHLATLPKLTGDCWTKSPEETGERVAVKPGERRQQLLGVGNAQSPFVAATAFRILANRHLDHIDGQSEVVSDEELAKVFEKKDTWIQAAFDHIGLVHTPTTMANYACKSMMKHQGCLNFTRVFGRPEPENAEYLMGFPLGASSPNPLPKTNIERWR